MIEKTMTIDTIFETFPDYSQKLAAVMQAKGLSCVGCGAATYETLEDGMKAHGMEKDIDAMVKKLNAVLEDKHDLSTITLTKKAADKFREFAAAEQVEMNAVRFALESGGCSGSTYSLDFSEKALENDRVYKSDHGIEIHVPKDHVEKLLGSEIDFMEGMHGSGFKINNPNVKRSCGCGNSQKFD